MNEFDTPDWGANFDWVNDDLFMREEQGLMRNSRGDVVAYTNADVAALAVNPKSSHQTLWDFTCAFRPDAGTETGLVRLLKPHSFTHRQPSHAPLKQLTVNRFTAQSLPDFREMFDAILDGLLANAVRAQRIDFITEFAQPAVAHFWARAIGLDYDQSIRLIGLASDVQQAVAIKPTPEQVEICNASSDTYLDILAGQLEKAAASRQYPIAVSLFSDFDTMDPTSRPDNPFDVFAAALIDAFHTLPAQLASLAYSLAEAEVDTAVHRADPMKFASSAFLEASRLHPTVTATMRHAIEEFDFNGVRIPQGTNIVMMWLFANRDPNVFPDPLEFRLARPKRTKQFTFGGGPFGCSGRNLVQAMSERMLFKIAANGVRLRLEDRPQWTVRTYLHELTTLPILVVQSEAH
jgi:cytochrome P450